MNEPRLRAGLYVAAAERDDGALVADTARPANLGAILIAAGRLSTADARRIADRQKETDGRFGEIALRLGILTADDIRYALGHQFAFPGLAPGDASIAAEVVTAFQAEHPIAEEMRALRERLSSHWGQPPARRPAVALVSHERGAGRSYVAANLAVVFAQLGRRTLLVDADVRQARQHELFRMQNRIGLSTVLAGRCGIECVQPVTSMPTLSVLTAGPMPPNLNDLFSRSSFISLLAVAQEAFEVLIFDAPPWTDGSAGRALALEAGTTLVVARANRSSAQGCRQIALELSQADRPALGVVLNKA